MKSTSIRTLTVLSLAGLSLSGAVLGASAQATPLAAVANAAPGPEGTRQLAGTGGAAAGAAMLGGADLSADLQRADARAAEQRRDDVAAARAEAERAARAEAERVAAEQAAATAAAEQVAAAQLAQRKQAEQVAASRSRGGGGSPKAIAADLVAARGWSASQFDCLDSLWTKESGWKVSADNPSSSAYGIPQALPGSKMSSAGGDWRTNPQTQITWGLGYIEDRYGSPCAAWSHSKSNNWY